ncbi:PH domain-containing protein [Psychroflexus gondwanensis]|uniref:PH domain-containing protein n=1 Tax=Psychroflexus gondwanensis TaxID=251 RepID=UPI0011BF9864|nr:PH domain-containing protein [Psychroflexus gondwanensis]TXE17926.1 PH domain-containing protein [Psychroflexus gondwanensis]
MNFENLEVHLDQLPDFKSVELNSVQKRYKKLIWINEGLVFILLFALPIVAFFFEPVPIWIPIVVLAILSFVLALRATEIEKGFPLRLFGIRQYDIIYQSGFFYFTETVIPYNRIQHLEIKQGPLSRFFNLYSLRLYTAGASSGDLIIDGLDKETAQKLKAKVLAKTTIIDE